jgi:hypothetical protein
MKFSQFGTKAVASIIAAASCFCVAQQAGFRLSTNSPRPLTDLIDQLNKRYGWCVNYEEAPVVAPNDLIDITSPTYEGPGRAYKFFSMPVTVQTNLPDPTVLSKQEEIDGLAVRAQEREAVEAILLAYRSSGNRGSFALSQNGKYIDVFPDKMRDQNGVYQPFEPMLSTKISIPDKAFRLDQLLWLVCDQVAQKRGIPIVHGTAPLGTFMAISLREPAEEEQAREVLVRAFEDTKAIRASHGAYDVRYFRWALLYDAGVQAYAMNIEWVSKDLPGKPDPTKHNESQSSGPPQWSQKQPTNQK